MIEKNRKRPVSAGQYATVADFKRIFTEDVNRLYLLSLLLTGDPENAEKCFVEGIGESTRGNHVFKEWARSWARRTIVQSAIRLISPLKWSTTATRSEDVVEVVDKVPVALHAEVCAILDLAPFDRFVFVMSVLERYSDNDCSILLGCPRSEIAPTRTRAIQRLVTLLRLKDNDRTKVAPEMAIELQIVQHFAISSPTHSLSR
jgi:DNA-directed RNA polymerase specialized sigma24 family protein